MAQSWPKNKNFKSKIKYSILSVKVLLFTWVKVGQLWVSKLHGVRAVS
jgi:hypothetical protein